MIFDWYKILNKTEFEASGLPSKEIDLILDRHGQKTILVTRGSFVSVVIEDLMLSAGMSGKNPFTLGGYAVYLDANNDLWIGIATTV